MPQAKRRIISADTARTLTTLLEGGHPRNRDKAAIPGFVASKTGTAQSRPQTGKYSSRSWSDRFSAMFQRKTATSHEIVVIDEPHGEAGVVWWQLRCSGGSAEQVLNYPGCRSR